MANLLTDEDYPTIRALIDTSLDGDSLPDEIIELPTFLAMGWLDVVAIDEDAEDREDDELVQVKAAACYFVAARLVLGIPDIIGETFGTEIYKRSATDRFKQSTLLRNMGLSILSDMLGTDLTDVRPKVFDRACGTRGRLVSRLPTTSPAPWPWGILY